MKHIFKNAFNINEHLSNFLILSVFYIVTNAFGGLAASVDFPILLFILFMHKVNDENFYYYAFIFGFFSDFVRGGAIGPGIIMFIIFSLMKVKADFIINVKKTSSRASFYVSLIFIYTFINGFLLNYSELLQILEVFKTFVLNCAAFLFGTFILRLTSASQNFEG